MAREVEVDILEALQGVKVKVMVDSDGTCRMNDPLSKSVYAHARKLAAEEAKAEGPYMVDDAVVYYMAENRELHFVSRLGSMREADALRDLLNSAHAAWLAQEPPKPWTVRVDSFPSGAGAAFYVVGPVVPEVTGRAYSTRKTAAEVADALNAIFAEGWQRKGGVVETMIGCNPNAAAILRGKGGAA